MDKKGYKKYIKFYISVIVKYLKEIRLGDVDKFKVNVFKVVEKILKSFDDWKFYYG